MFKISVDSKDVESKFKALEQRAADLAFNRAVQDVASKIGEISGKDVPVMEGILKSTFTYQKIRGIWYIGYNTEYGLYQHEGRDREGNKIIKNRPGGGKTKFLTGTVERNKDQIMRLISVQFYNYLSSELKKIF